MNFLKADRPLPKFFWTGKTEMACMRSCLKQVLDTGYGHHIQRLMVIGLYSLLHGVRPGEINDWFLANYVDAVDWVTTPNVVGMSQFADGGIMASKPYSATGAYIDRMSNYCKKCRFKPKESTGPDACPLLLCTGISSTDTGIAWGETSASLCRCATSPVYPRENLLRSEKEQISCVVHPRPISTLRFSHAGKAV